MSEPETIAEAATTKIPRGWRRWLLMVLAILLLLTAIGGGLVYLFGYDAVKWFVQSEAGRQTASRSVGKSIKVDGEFAPLKLDGWTIVTDSFESRGWPGEAIGGLNCYGVRAEFDPAAVWRGVYRFNGIQIERGNFNLRTPNDALKRPMPPKKPKPWYAHFLPSVFECGPMISPDANVDFEFQGKEAAIQHTHLQANLIGRDFQYHAEGGTMVFPMLPPMHIDKLVIMVTRPMLTIEDAELSSVTPADPARMSLHGDMGQRENKKIEAIVEVTQMPIEQLLPDTISSLIHGRATGHLIWKRDESGKDVLSEGEIDLAGASINNLSVFAQLALLHGNPDLNDFVFDQLHMKFEMHNGLFDADIVAVSPGKFSLAGHINYDLKSKMAGLNLRFGDLPLKTWLPSEFKPRVDGVAWAWLKWNGHLNEVKDSSGTVMLNLDGTKVSDPVNLRRFLASKSLRAPEEIYFKTSQFDFSYHDQTFQLTRAQIDAPGILTANATASLTSPEKELDGEIDWQGLTVEKWLPEKVAREITGQINGGVKFHVAQFKYKDGSYAGSMEMTKGQLSYTPVQSMMARFVNDRRLLEIPLDRARCDYKWNDGALAITGIDLRGDDSIAIKGDLMMDRAQKLSGTLWVGLKPEYIGSLMELGDEVFVKKESGLRWAKVKVSGTSKEPKQDLSSQIMGQLGSHPLAVFGLGGKAISWYVGNAFGEKEDWERPKPQVHVEASKN